MIKGILNHMAEYRNMRKFVLHVKSENRKLKESSTILDHAKPEKNYVTRMKAYNSFSNEQNINTRKAEEICKAAIKHNYVYVAVTGEKGKYLPAADYLEVNPKEGYNLIQQRWLVPTGLIREAVKENSTLINITVGVVVAIATVVNVIIVLIR